MERSEVVSVVRRLADRCRDDAGFTLVEMMVAALVLLVVAAATAGAFVTTMKTTANDRSRTAAANLASREVEIVRQQFTGGSIQNLITIGTQVNANPLPGGVVGQPIVVDNVPFTVTDDIQPLLNGPNASSCNGGTPDTAPSYRLRVRVTWPGATADVVNQTILTPPKGFASSNSYAYLAVSVTNASGNPTSNVVVQMNGPSGSQTRITDSSGCAVGVFTTGGTFTVSLNTAGYVDQTGNPTPTSPALNVSLGSLQIYRMTYDRAAQLAVTFAAPAGYALPATLPYVTLGNSGIQPNGQLSLPASGVTTTAGNLWPFPSGYTAWAGSCSDADPAASGGTRSGPAVLAPGGAGSLQVNLAALNVAVVDSSGRPVANASVMAQKPQGASGGCLQDATLTLGTTNASGTLAVALPYGTWQLAVGSAPNQVTGDTVVLGPNPSSGRVVLP